MKFYGKISYGLILPFALAMFSFFPQKKKNYLVLLLCFCQESQDLAQELWKLCISVSLTQKAAFFLRLQVLRLWAEGGDWPHNNLLGLYILVKLLLII